MTRDHLVAAIVVLCATVSVAYSGERPFKGQGSGRAIIPCDASGACTGHEEGTYTGTHLGRSTYVSDFTSQFVDPACGSTTGSSVFTTPSGDEIHFDFEQDFCFDQNGVSNYTGTYTATGGTGRFADATGSGTLSGTAACGPGGVCANNYSISGTGDY